MLPAHALPHLAGDRPFVTDGGLETTLIFKDGLDLPEFAAFVLLDEESGREALRAYFAPYLRLAVERGTGIVLDTPTWRANPDWGAKLGYTTEALDRVNREAVAFARATGEQAAGAGTPVVVDGVVGPRGDGYDPDSFMSAADAERYHDAQIASFAAAGADMVSAITMTYAAEAIGIVRAARRHELPVVISFTVETDGRLPDGTALRAAIEEVDAATDGAPVYYMINCAHPEHFDAVLEDAGPWRERIGGVRANASTKSHAELDEAEELDEGDPDDLGRRYAALRERLPNVTVLGGCCGTDIRHVAAATAAWGGVPAGH